MLTQTPHQIEAFAPYYHRRGDKRRAKMLFLFYLAVDRDAIYQLVMGLLSITIKVLRLLDGSTSTFSWLCNGRSQFGCLRGQLSMIDFAGRMLAQLINARWDQMHMIMEHGLS